MNIHENDDGVYISSQISTDDLQAIADVGIRTVICNRPDREDEGQPDFLLIQQAAAEYNISLYYVPVTGSGVAENSLQAMITILTQAERPLLAYCRSGNRSDTIYRLAKKIMAG
ncbi:MAG: hypothetical protein JSC085_000415 [Candidatus Tokpelaia sp. JSC085]|nr:MAG: hypothetical protein JSC085_000415 [Candidatus Tokpelaia sp. JSC085]